MADTPEQAPAPASGGGGEGGQPAAPSGGGMASYLPLVIVLVLTPLLAISTIMLKSWWDKKKASAPTEEHAEADKEKEEAPKKAESAHGGGHGAAKEKEPKKGKSSGRNTKLPIPVTRDAVAYHAKDKEGDSDKFVLLDLKGEPRDEAKSDKIVVNIAGTSGTRFAVARLSLLGEHPDLVERVNISRERLLDVASGAISSLSLDDTEKPGFRNLLRQQLLALFNDVLGRGTIQEVIITEFIVQ